MRLPGHQPGHQDGLEELAEILAGLFYLLIFVALLAVATSSPGTALGLLVLGSCVHVVRVGVEDLTSSEDRAGLDVGGSLRRLESAGRAMPVVRHGRSDTGTASKRAGAGARGA